MIVCPNCNHQNPEGATQCEACYTPLPATTTCPNCGAPVQTDASFCGQCGSNLTASPATATAPVAAPDAAVPDLAPLEPLVEAEPLAPNLSAPAPTTEVETEIEAVSVPDPVTETSAPLPSPASPSVTSSKTQLQQQTAKLLHVQTNTLVDLPSNLSVIHIGKPNDRIPPDVDVAGFPSSEIVSRIHADIRVEGGAHYIEDVGSSNGTYINNMALPPGNRHRLRAGDRIALGKGDLVTFLFQIS